MTYPQATAYTPSSAILAHPLEVQVADLVLVVYILLVT